MDEADRSKEQRGVPSVDDTNWHQVPAWERIGQSIGRAIPSATAPWRAEDWVTVTGNSQPAPDTSSLLDVLKQISDNQALLAQTLTKLVEELQRRG